MACHHRLWAVHTVERHRAYHAIITLYGKHRRTTSGVACHHRHWAPQIVERCRAWHAIIALELQTRSNDVWRDMPSPPLDSTHGRTTSGKACHHRLWAHKRLNDVRRGMPSLPLGSTNGRTTPGLACHHRLWAVQKVRRRRALHAIIAFGRHTQSNDVGRCMPSSPLGSTHGRTTSGVACHHRLWAAHMVD